MIGIGIDLVEMKRFGKCNRLVADLVLTADEKVEYNLRQRSIHYLATRWAAKEAAIKAIGHHVDYQAISITNDENGKPLLSFSNIKVKNAMVSISDETDYVVAMVVLE